MKNFTAFTFLSVVLLLALGTWQLYRLQVKTKVINLYQARLSQPPLTTPIDLSGGSDLRYYKIKLLGKFIDENEIHLYAGGRGYSSQSNGYLIVTPFRLENGQIILVNRGIVPAEKKSITSRKETLTNQQLIEVSGVLFKGEQGSIFLPENDLKRNIWFVLDLTKIKAYTQLNLITNYYIVQDNKHDVQGLLTGRDTSIINIHNDHLQYAITWYSLAVAIAVLFFKYKRKGT